MWVSIPHELRPYTQGAHCTIEPLCIQLFYFYHFHLSHCYLLLSSELQVMNYNYAYKLQVTVALLYFYLLLLLHVMTYDMACMTLCHVMCHVSFYMSCMCVCHVIMVPHIFIMIIYFYFDSIFYPHLCIYIYCLLSLHSTLLHCSHRLLFCPHVNTRVMVYCACWLDSNFSPARHGLHIVKSICWACCSC